MREPDGQGAEGRDEPGLPLLPGFREMALRRMAGERRRLVSELTAQRQAAGLSQTEVAARMGTSQSAVARLEAGGAADVRASTLERYAAALGSHISWRLQDALPDGPLQEPGPDLAPVLPPRPGPSGLPGQPGSPGLRPVTGPLAPAALHRPSGWRQEDSHDHPRS